MAHWPTRARSSSNSTPLAWTPHACRPHARCVCVCVCACANKRQRQATLLHVLRAPPRHSLVCIDDRRRRYDAVLLVLRGATLSVRTSRIGEAGTVKTQTFKSVDTAWAAFDRRLAGCMEKGYSAAGLADYAFVPPPTRRRYRPPAAGGPAAAALAAASAFPGGAGSSAGAVLAVEAGQDWSAEFADGAGLLPSITRAWVRALAPNDATFDKAEDYHARGKVLSAMRRGATLLGACSGTDAAVYRMRLRLACAGLSDATASSVPAALDQVRLVSGHCTCPQAMFTPGRCKHCLALLLLWAERPDAVADSPVAGLSTTFLARAFAMLSRDDRAAAAATCHAWRQIVETAVTRRWHALVFSPPSAAGEADEEGEARQTPAPGGAATFASLGAWAELRTDGPCAYTLELWVKPRARRASGVLVSRCNRGVAADFEFGLESGRLRMFRNKAPWQLLGTSELQPNVWTHVAVTYGSLWCRLFVNGSVEAACEWAPTEELRGQPVLLGASRDDGAPCSLFAGAIQELRIWRRSLEPALVAELVHRPPSALLAPPGLALDEEARAQRAAVLGDLVARFKVNDAGDWRDDVRWPALACELAPGVTAQEAGFRLFLGGVLRGTSTAASGRNGALSSQAAAAAALGGSWVIDADELSFGDVLGQGAFGQVFRGDYRGRVVAIKKLLDSIASDEARIATFVREIDVVSRLRPSPYVVEFVGASVALPHCCLVMEFVPGGSLDRLVLSNRPLSVGQRVAMALDAAQGMAHIHSERVIHQDLALRNLLVDDALHVKISDFGLSRIRKTTNSLTEVTQAMGTPSTMAPELIQGHVISNKIDVFSFGVLLWQLYTRLEPWTDATPMQIAWKVVMESARPAIPAHCPERLRLLIQSAWAQDAKDRPTFDEIVSALRIIAATT